MRVNSIAVALMLTGVVYGQPNRAVEAGSKEAHRLQVRQHESAIEHAQAAGIASAAAPFSGVRDAESFAKASNIARARDVQLLYKRREAARMTKTAGKKGQEEVTKINAQIEKINDPTKPYFPDVSSDSIISSHEAFRSFIVEDVVGKRDAILECKEYLAGAQSKVFWLTGIDTTGWTDGKSAKIDIILIRSGTATYPTADGGQSTIPKMRPLTMPPASMLDRHDDVREWHSKGDKVSTGALVIYDLGKVKIKDMGGKSTTLRFSDLSDDDKAYVSGIAPTPKPIAK